MWIKSSLFLFSTLQLKSIDTPDDLYHYVVQLPIKLALDKRLGRSSYIGMYLRAQALKMKQMSLPALMCIYDSWVAHLECVVSTYCHTRGSGSDVERRAHDFHSARLANRRTSEQLNLCSSPFPRESRVTSLNHIPVNGGNIPSKSESIYVAFLQAWKRGDYSSSLTLLSRYFDYTVPSQGRSSYQYALLNLALLQSDFGCSRESLRAIFETIDAARDYHDEHCLEFAMSWFSDAPSSAIGSFYHKRARQDINPSVIAGGVSSHTLVLCPTHDPYIQLHNVSVPTRTEIHTRTSTSIVQYLSSADFWARLDVLCLSDTSLRLASGLVDIEEDSEAGARLICTIARRYWETHSESVARKYLSIITSKHTNNRAFQHIVKVQEAHFTLAAGRDSPAAASLEALANELNPMAVAPYVRRLIKKRHLSYARDVLHKHLGTVSASRSRSVDHQIMLFKLLGETYQASGSVVEAIVLYTRALQLAYRHSFFKDCRELQNYLSDLE